MSEQDIHDEDSMNHNIFKFSGKAENYTKYRPSYPKEFIMYLKDELFFNEQSIVADIGAGTGQLSKDIATIAKYVYAIEPNIDMRNECITNLIKYSNINIIDGTAEKTTLNNKLVDKITVAQAFHWFDQEKCKKEFSRILKKNGMVTLVWNTVLNKTEFIIAYEKYLYETCPLFNGFGGGFQLETTVFGNFFKQGLYEHRIFNNDTIMDRESFIGGSLSSSYAPRENDSNYFEFVLGLEKIFEQFQSNKKLLKPLETHSFTGTL